MWCRLDAMILEDGLDRVASGVVAESLKATAHARVAPRRILPCHADHQRDDVRLGAGTTKASRGRAVVFLRHQRPIPARDRVRCDNADDGRKPPPPDGLAFHGQEAALVVRETEPSGSVRGTKAPILLEQVLNNRLLLPVDPAGEDQNDEGERSGPRVHRASVPQSLKTVQGHRDSRSCAIMRPIQTGRVPGPRAACAISSENAPILG
jgi:hypothetical protein